MCRRKHRRMHGRTDAREPAGERGELTMSTRSTLRGHLHGPTRGRQATFAAATVQLFLHAAPAPSPQPSPSSWVPTCQFSSYFIILLLVTLPCYCLLFITATPLRRLRYAVTRAPLSRSLRDGPGRLGTGPGRTRQSKPLYIHARTNWLVRQWALLHGPARAGPRWVSGGQELDRGKAIAHRSVLNDA